MKKLNLIYLLICTLIFGACKDDTFGDYGDYSEGQPATLVGSIKVPSHKKIASRAMGAERETAIEELALIAWETNSGRKMAIDLTGKLKNQSWTPQGASVYELNEPIDVLTGKYRVYFVANWKSFYGRKENTNGTEMTFEELSNMTEDELKQVIFWNYGDHIDLYGNDGFPMTQVIDNYLIENGTNKLTGVNLTRASAHIHFKIYNGNQGLTAEEEAAGKRIDYSDGNEPNFVPMRYAVFRAPSHTNAFKEGESNVQIGKDDVFDLKDYVSITATPDQEGERYYEFDFHMLENRQPIVENIKDFGDRERWNFESTTPNVDLESNPLSHYDREFTNAPAGATFVVIEGTYSGPAEKDADGKYTHAKYIGNVTYIIHLGNFNTEKKYENNTQTGPEGHEGSLGDFSVLRNELQEITIRVQGARQILVNVDVSKPDEHNPAVEGDISQQPVAYLDAHYSKVMLEIPIATIKENLDENTVAITSYKNGFNNTIYTHEQLETDPNIDYKWVQFQKPTEGKDIFPKYAGKDNHRAHNDNTKTDGYGYVTDLIHDLAEYKANPTTHELKYATVDGDVIYTAAFVDENVYHDLTGDTQIKTWAGVNVKDRRLALNPDHRQVSPNGTNIVAGITAINIRQRPVISTYSLNQTGSFAGYNPFGLEQVQEPSATIESLEKGIRPTLYGTTTEMTTDNDAIYTSTYRAMYDKNCFWFDSPKKYASYDEGFESNKIEERDCQHNTRRLFPDFDKTNGVEDDYKSFYKKTSSGSYEFVPADDYITATKALVVHNRDLNGNGYIEGDELQWYIPGYVQLLIFNYGYKLIPENQRLQQRADEIRISGQYPGENNFDKVFARYLTSSHGIRRLYWHEQRGASSFLNRPGIDNMGGTWMPQLNHIRFARSLGQFEGADTARYTYMSQRGYAGGTEHKNNVRYLNPGIARTFHVTEFYPFHYCTDEFNYLPYAQEYLATPLQLWSESDGGSEWPGPNLRKTVTKDDGTVDLEASAAASQEAIYRRVIEKFNANTTLTDAYGPATEYDEANNIKGKLPAGWRVTNQRELLSLFVVQIPYEGVGSNLSNYKNAEFLSCSFIIPDLYTDRYNVPVMLSGGVITLPGGYARPNGYVILVRDIDPYTATPIVDSKAAEASARVGRGILKR